ncbi:RNA polymerase sigma factor [Sphingobacterium endophyticum]|uniref:RNA polymerase sigma factor n=1 Tax=Sphingobacterium endophyticum TaxID=2546448 RepID=UPI0012E0E8B3|nr:sigma-70 family RNA polymerase sigma factor [Sphingobacterium endophyticum]
MIDFDREVTNLQQGQESALCFFMDQYSHALHFHAYKFVKNKDVAREIVSDAFVKLWERRLNFDSEERIKSFLYLVTRNECLDYLKQSRNKYQHDEEFLVGLESTEENILTKIIYTELIELIVKEIEKLPKQQGQIFQLSVLEGKETEEICEELGTTASNVYFSRSKAISTLKKVFKHKNISYYQLSLLLFIIPEL